MAARRSHPTIGINDVLVRVLRTGICGTDVHIYNWDASAQKTIPVPMVVGHEFVGRVVGWAPTLTTFTSATSSAERGMSSAGAAVTVLRGGDTSARTRKGIGVNRPGAFAEYIALPMTNVWVHESGNGASKISRTSRRYSIHLAMPSIPRLSFDVLGEDVLITGAGPIGCMAAAVVQHAGARYVVIPTSTRTGWNWRGDGRTGNRTSVQTLAAVQNRLGMTEGFDVGLESAERGRVPRHAGQYGTRRKDRHARHPAGGEMSIDWNTVIFNMLTIKGIYGREMYETWYKMTVMLQSGLDLEPVITHRLHYTEFQKGFDAMLSGKSGKVVLTWSEG